MHTAHAWSARIGRDIGTEDRRAFAYRLTRAWLHAVRDRLDVPAAAHLGAQLPELLRGVYYDRWMPEPAHVSAVLPAGLVGVLSGQTPPEYRVDSRDDDAIVAETVEIAE